MNMFKLHNQRSLKISIRVHVAWKIVHSLIATYIKISAIKTKVVKKKPCHVENYKQII